MTGKVKLKKRRTSCLIHGFSLLLSLAGLVPGGFAEHICWWLDQRPPRVLGVIGLVLVLAWALLTGVAAIYHIHLMLHPK